VKDISLKMIVGQPIHGPCRLEHLHENSYFLLFGPAPLKNSQNEHRREF
jgi:hypothetical protein